MMTRIALLTCGVLFSLSPIGCRKPVGSPVASGPTVSPAPAVAPIDYRTLTVVQLEALINDKTRNPVTLKAAGPNKYTGTRPSPDGTIQVPVTVTVEKERIMIETSGGGMSSREIITPRGLQVDDVR